MARTYGPSVGSASGRSSPTRAATVGGWRPPPITIALARAAPAWAIGWTDRADDWRGQDRGQAHAPAYGRPGELWDFAPAAGGRVVWIEFEAEALALGPSPWLGWAPGQRLTSITDGKITKFVKGNAQGIKLERANLRVVPRARFDELGSIEEVVKQLFGRFPVDEAPASLKPSPEEA